MTKNKVDLTKYVDGDTDSEQVEDLEAAAKMEYIGIGQQLKEAYSVVVVVYMSIVISKVGIVRGQMTPW